MKELIVLKELEIFKSSNELRNIIALFTDVFNKSNLKEHITFICDVSKTKDEELFSLSFKKLQPEKRDLKNILNIKNLDEVERHLQSLQKDSPVYLIYYNGVPLEMRSNKCGWKTLAAAKNALIQELSFFNTYENKISKDIVKQLLKSKVIQIKEIL